MFARVVTKRDDARLAMTLTSLAAIALLAVLANDAWKRPFLSPPGTGSYVFVAIMIALGAVAPWLAWARRGRAVQVRVAGDVVHAGRIAIAARDVRAVSVVRAARGVSVAVAHARRRLTFLEVERGDDAARIASALGPASPLSASLLPRAGRVLAIPQALLSLVALASSALYYVDTVMAPFAFRDGGKTLFGLAGFAATQLAFWLLALRCASPAHAVVLGRGGAWEAHLAMHRAAAEGAQEKGGATADPDATPADATTGGEESHAGGERAFPLARGDEGVRAWLARLDALPTGQHAYRGHALQKDALWETLGDAGARVDARQAAARVLRLRHGEDGAALVRVVDDPDVRRRVSAALVEDEDEAERQLESLGPLFRAR